MRGARPRAPALGRAGTWLALVAVLLAAYAGFWADTYDLRVLTLAGVYALMALGFQFVFGLAGLFSLAQGAFFGLGAYVAALSLARAGLPFAAAFALAALAPALVAAAVALPVLRLEGHYFALATLGIAQMLLILAVNWESVTGGANGIAGLPPARFLGLTLGYGLPTLALVWALVGLGALWFRREAAGWSGLAYAALRETPLAAAAIGLDARAMRLRAFAASAALGGASGALHAAVVGVVSPEAASLTPMITCLAIAVIGGRGRAAGAVIGALLLVHLPEWFRFLERHVQLAYGLALLAAVLAAPEGLVGLAERWLGRIWPAPVPPPPAPCTPPAPASAGTLRIEGLAKRFGGVVALAGVDLEVGAGEAIGIIGPNGSGKTTLLNIVGGQLAPDAGRVRFAGTATAGLPAFRIARLGLARTFQTADLVPEMAVLDAVALARQTAGAAPGRARGEAMALLERAGLADAWARRCGDLPPGLRRRVEVARALALRPALLALDEPAAGLSESEAAAVRDLLAGVEAEGVTLLVVDHDMRFLLALARRLVCLDQGRVIADGPAAAVVADPTVRRVYLGDRHGG